MATATATDPVSCTEFFGANFVKGTSMRQLKQWQRDAVVLFLMWLGLVAVAAAVTGGGVLRW